MAEVVALRREAITVGAVTSAWSAAKASVPIVSAVLPYCGVQKDARSSSAHMNVFVAILPQPSENLVRDISVDIAYTRRNRSVHSIEPGRHYLGCLAS